MAEEQEILKRLEGILRNPDHFADLKSENITSETKVRDLKLDSLDLYELVYAIENEFKVHIPDEKAHEFEAVKDYIDFIKNY